MTLDDLVAQFRTDADDAKRPYLFDDDDVIRWLNEAEEEAALRANLLFEASDPDVCRIAVTAGERFYDLHDAVFSVRRAQFTPDGTTDACTLAIADRVELERVERTRRSVTDKPVAIIVDDTRIELDCIPDTDGLIELEVYRAPLSKMTDGGNTPEISRVHHRFLPLWALHRAYGRPDAEAFDQGRSDRAELAFTKQFGIRPDADQRRAFQANTPMHNKAYF